MDWRFIIVTTAIIMIASNLFLASSAKAIGGHDGQEYKVVDREGSIEVRDYSGYITAYVDVASDFDGALNSGFMKLFNYISGKNTNRSKIKMTVPVTEEQVAAPEKIPMTAPVTSEKISGGVYRVSFVMPAGYTLGTLPVPDDKSIKFKEYGPFKAAVITFRGRMNERLANEKTQELRNWLEKKGMQPRSNFTGAQYDPPWMPGFMRKNEVIAQI